MVRKPPPLHQESRGECFTDASQATFTALNVEPENNLDDDVDNTRELQVPYAPPL